MSEDEATRAIHALLEGELRARRGRALLGLFALALPIAVWPGLSAHGPALHPAALAALGAQIALMLGFWAVSSFPALRVPRVVARLGPLAILFVPALFGRADAGAVSHAKCAALVGLTTALAIVLLRSAMGPRSRRFGGGLELTLAAAAGAGLAGIGLTCPGEAPLHQLAHGLGAASLLAVAQGVFDLRSVGQGERPTSSS